MNRRPIRVQYVVPTVGIGGVETFIRQTARLHDPSAVEATYCFLRKGPLLEGFPGKIRIAPVFPRLRHPIEAAKSIRWLAQVARDDRADLIHSSMAYGALFGAIAARKAGVPHLWFQHGPVAGWMDRLAGALPAAALVANSAHTLGRQKALELPVWPRSQRKNRLEKVMHLGAGEHPLSAAGRDERVISRKKQRAQMQAGDNDWVAVMACRLQEWKGVEIFIEAIASLNREASEHRGSSQPVQGWVIGASESESSQNDYERSLRELVTRLRAPIRFVPALADPIPAIAAADTLVNASLIPEPFGYTLVEAMSVGTIPVAPSCGGPAEFIVHGKNGLLFRQGDAKDLARAMSRLRGDPEASLALSKNAEETVRSRLNARGCVASLEALYREIVSTQR